MKRLPFIFLLCAAVFLAGCDKPDANKPAGTAPKSRGLIGVSLLKIGRAHV